MAREHIFESRARYGITASIEEQFGDGGLATDNEPGTKTGTGPLPNRQDSFASAFSEDSNERPRLNGYVIGSQTDQFGDSEESEALVRFKNVYDYAVCFGCSKCDSHWESVPGATSLPQTVHNKELG